MCHLGLFIQHKKWAVRYVWEIALIMRTLPESIRHSFCTISHLHEPISSLELIEAQGTFRASQKCFNFF